MISDYSICIKGFLGILISGIERSILLWEKMAQNRMDCPKLGAVSKIWNITVLCFADMPRPTFKAHGTCFAEHAP